MKASLIGYTGIGMHNQYAPALLVFTKNTRLEMKPDSLYELVNGPWSVIEKELEYMSNTIPSSWEFIDYTFSIQNVTRAFTHQFVRTRTGSYAQQTMRVLNVDGFTHETGPSIEIQEDLKAPYEEFMKQINEFYNWLIEAGAQIEDARGVLPTNIHTNIVCKFNLRTLAEMAQKRSSPRTQFEYRKVLDQMINLVLEVHPWAEMFLRNRKADAAKMLDSFINHVFSDSNEPVANINKIDLLKAVDILRQ